MNREPYQSIAQPMDMALQTTMSSSSSESESESERSTEVSMRQPEEVLDGDASTGKTMITISNLDND